MPKPIILWQCERTLSTDDAGVTILSSASPPHTYLRPGPYYDEDTVKNRVSESRCRVPPLSYFCIKCLVQAPELIYHYGPPRPYIPPESPSDPDILQALIPRTQQGHFDLGKVDPRLWAIIVQVYSDLPHGLQTYRTALSDKYTPLLQHVPATEHFALLTVVELPGCSHLNDDTIVHLKALHTLCVLDVSRTAISALGIRRLSRTLTWGEDGVDSTNQRRGPWRLRILSLYDCKRVTNTIYQFLESFILLAAVDLRGTSCTWDREKIPPSFFPAVEKRLYYPTSPLEALSLLSNSEGLLPSSNSGVLHIDHLTHGSPERPPGFGMSSSSRSSVMAGDSHTALLTHRGVNYSPDEPFQRATLEEPEAGTTDPCPIHAAVMDSDAHAAQYKAKMFYSQRAINTCSSATHPPRHMPQWGQELLMLHREPPPWSQTQLPPIVNATSRRRSHEEPVSINRTNKRAMKGVQEMNHMLSERHRPVTMETDSSCNDVMMSNKLSTPRNPFAVSLSKSSAHVHETAHEETSAPPRTNPVTKSVMAAPPKSLRSLKLRPISCLPVPTPPVAPDPSQPARATQHSRPGRCGPRESHDSNWNDKPASEHINEFHGQKADMSLALTTGRSAESAKPAAARRRPTRAASAGGSKKQEPAAVGFDWSSWSAPR
ncbi:hypothetical protein BC826DRAFT_986662 [Russula brevipes]|nr:hypothetical protein BC826DRAFT_986662 [Russula brevipes]